MAQIVRKIPDQLSARGTTSQGQYNLQDNAYDYAVGGIPFLSGTSDQRPYTENMAEVRKQQFDNFAEPGEQSLYGWWLRSQSTFTGGAGLLYQDPDNDNQFNFRFADSLGVDPWTSGEVKLLRNTELGIDAGLKTNVVVRGFVGISGLDSYWMMYGDELRRNRDDGTVVVIAAGGATNYALTSSGYTYYIARGTGVFRGTDSGGAPTQIYNTALTNGAMEFLKGRLILGTNNSIYQLQTNPAGAPVALPTATYTHQDTLWRWRSITDGPTAIYAAGDNGTNSEIHKFTPSLDSGGLPVLTWAGVTATLPLGEQVNTIYQYVGSFVGIATTKGFRVGEIDANGDISYGPLLFTITGGCKGIVGYDRFMWTGSTNQHDGVTGLYRIDLGSVIQEQTTRAVRYAYCRDISYNGTGQVTSVTMFGNSDRKVFGIEAVGSAKEKAAELVPSGYLKTGRIRYNTEEPKLYKFFSVRTPPLLGPLSVAVLDQGGGETNYITFTDIVEPGTGDIATPTPAGPQTWIALKFTLQRGTNPAQGAILNGWQVKALPGSIRQRIITQVFQCFDEEQDKTGQRIGYDGYARQRLDDFQVIARAGDITLYQELAEDRINAVVIDNWEFRQTAAPGPNRGATGGYLTVVMRTVAEST